MRASRLDLTTLLVETFEPGPPVSEPVTPPQPESGAFTCGGALTQCYTCVCPHTSPQPSCESYAGTAGCPVAEPM